MVRAGEQQYKVGVATNVHKRVKGLQTSNGHEIQLVAAKKTTDASAVERSIHADLAAHKLNGGREWFSLTPEQALDICVTINSTPDVAVRDIEELRVMLADHSTRQRKINAKLDDLLVHVDIPKPKIEPKKEKVVREVIDRNALKEKENEEFYEKALTVVRTLKRASTSLLQRELVIGYGRASRIIDRMEKEHIISAPDGIKPRRLLNPVTQPSLVDLDPLNML